MERSAAIVLRVFDWSETSSIVHLFTREHGKRHAVAKGARRRRSPFEGALDLLAQCDVVFIPKSGDALDVLTEAKLRRRFRVASRDLLRLYCGYYVIELVERLTEIGDVHRELFDLTAATVGDLDSQRGDVRSVLLRFELGLLRQTGLLPGLQRCVHCGQEWNRSSRAGEREGWYVFSALGGGFYCPACDRLARHPVRVTSDVHRAMVRFSDPDWKAIAVDAFPPHCARPVRRIMKELFRVHLERPPRMERFLGPLEQ
ncbi:MAG: DNA repair protein RecO [Pirellulaceae bacterium]|nr:MAG: DNA repair protein RecO [Pirellulaceae bacterium]